MTIYQRMTEYEIIRRQEQKIEKLEAELEECKRIFNEIHRSLNVPLNDKELKFNVIQLNYLLKIMLLIPQKYLFNEKQEG